MLASVVRRLAVGVLLAVLLLLAWTAVVLLQARADLEAARDGLTALREEGATADLDARLAASERQLARATDRLDDPGPALAAEVPVLGRTPEAVRRTSEAALAAVRAVRGVLAAGADDALLRDGRVDLDAVGRVADEADRRAAALSGPVARLDDVDLGLVPGTVHDAVVEAQGELAGLPDTLDRAAEALRALQSLLGQDEPRRVLVVLQNNAELRSTGGLLSVFAEVQADDGALVLGSFRDVDDVADPPETAERVPAPEDYSAVFGPLLADTTLWRNTNADPDVPRSSAVLAEVAQATLGAAPDAVVWLDVRAVAAVLRATSPAQLPDGTLLTGDNAVEVLLADAYEGVAEDEDAQDARRARLRAAGDAVAQRLLGGTPDVPRLAESLSAAAAGRHLAVWSAREDEQRAWDAAELAGALPEDVDDLASVAVHNLGGGQGEGNKLDLYARRSVTVRAVVDGGTATVEREVVLRNESPEEGLPLYVAGRDEPGTTNNLVLHLLPPGAREVVLRRGDAVLDVEPRPLGPAVLVEDVVSLPPGTAATWRLTYEVPVDGSYDLAVVPQPLAVDAELAVEVVAADGVRLSVPPGSPLSGDDARLAAEGPFDEVVEAAVEVERPGLLGRVVDAVRRFWSEPVELPF